MCVTVKLEMHEAKTSMSVLLNTGPNDTLSAHHAASAESLLLYAYGTDRRTDGQTDARPLHLDKHVLFSCRNFSASQNL